MPPTTPPAEDGRRAAVLGHPIAHSLSPVLHLAAYRALGLDAWTYTVEDVSADELAAFVGRLDDSWAGLSLTMPLKQQVIPLLDYVEPLAGLVGAVNTVIVQPVGGRRPITVGANTDVYGIVQALREADADPAPGAVVLGAGATAASALAALAQLGASAPTVLVRSLGRTGPLQRAAHRMGLTPSFASLDDAAGLLPRAGVVVSTLPAHAADAIAERLPAGPIAGALLDVVYDPRPTALAEAWLDRGGRSAGGERMLLHQAVEQVRLMTGLPAPIDVMDAALGRVLDGS